MISIVGRVLAVVVAIVAMRVADVRPQHRPLARWLAASAAADVAAWIVAAGLLGYERPYCGGARVLHHAGQALGLVEPVGLAAVAVIVFVGNATAVVHAVGAGVALLCAMIIGYPAVLRGPMMAYWYGAIEVVALIIVAASIVHAGRQRRWPTMTEVLVVLYGAVRLSLLVAGPYVAPGGPFVAWWSGDGAQFTAVTVALLVHLGWLRAIVVR